jgi:hypothetical protein
MSSLRTCLISAVIASSVSLVPDRADAFQGVGAPSIAEYGDHSFIVVSRRKSDNNRLYSVMCHTIWNDTSCSSSGLPTTWELIPDSQGASDPDIFYSRNAEFDSRPLQLWVCATWPSGIWCTTRNFGSSSWSTWFQPGPGSGGFLTTASARPAVTMLWEPQAACQTYPKPFIFGVGASPNYAWKQSKMQVGCASDWLGWSTVPNTPSDLAGIDAGTLSYPGFEQHVCGRRTGNNQIYCSTWQNGTWSSWSGMFGGTAISGSPAIIVADRVDGSGTHISQKHFLGVTQATSRVNARTMRRTNGGSWSVAPGSTWAEIGPGTGPSTFSGVSGVAGTYQNNEGFDLAVGTDTSGGVWQSWYQSSWSGWTRLCTNVGTGLTCTN